MVDFCCFELGYPSPIFLVHANPHSIRGMASSSTQIWPWRGEGWCCSALLTGWPGTCPSHTLPARLWSFCWVPKGGTKGAALSLSVVEQKRHTVCCAFFPLDSVLLSSEETASFQLIEPPYPISTGWDTAELS